jgi:hypothetical protein
LTFFFGTTATYAPLEKFYSSPNFSAVQKGGLKEVPMTTVMVAAGLISLLCLLGCYWMTGEENTI